jgi:G-patch domain
MSAVPFKKDAHHKKMNYGAIQLRKYGWREGVGIGKRGDGRLKAIQAYYKKDKVGLKSTQEMALDCDPWWERVFERSLQNSQICVGVGVITDQAEKKKKREKRKKKTKKESAVNEKHVKRKKKCQVKDEEETLIKTRRLSCHRLEAEMTLGNPLHVTFVKASRLR